MLRTEVTMDFLTARGYLALHDWKIEDAFNAIKNKDGARVFLDYSNETVTFRFFKRYEGIQEVTAVIRRPMTDDEIQSLQNDGEVHIKEYQYSNVDCYEIFQNEDGHWIIRNKGNEIDSDVESIDEASERVRAAIISKDNAESLSDQIRQTDDDDDDEEPDNDYEDEDDYQEE